MALTKLNSLAIPASTIVTDDLTYPLTNFSSTGIDDNATSTAITIDASENVGIGTTVADSKMVVAVGDNGPAASGTMNTGVVLQAGVGSAALNMGSNNAAGYSWINAAFANNSSIPSRLVLMTGAQERFRIDTSGNVKIATDGINTTTSKGLFWGSSAFNRADISVTNTSVYAANMGFSTGNNANYQTRMTLDSLGNLLVGTTQVRLTEFSQTDSGINLLGQSGQEGQIQAQTSGTSTLILSRRSSDGAIVDLRKDGTTKGTIGAYGNDIGFAVNGGLVRIRGHSVYREGAYGSGLHFTTNAVIPANENGSVSTDTENLGIASYRWKDLYLSGGAYIGGTGSANYLDDYEEGTWTPSIASGSATFYDATYTKVGRMVTLSVLMISISDLSSGTALQINGLPFTTLNTSIATSVGLSRFMNRGNGTIVAYVGGNNNVVNFYALSAGADYLVIRHSDLNNANVNYYLNLTYQAA